MAQTGTLHDAFISELRDTYDAEKQLIKALPKMVKAATSGGLKEALERHLEETRAHAARLEQVFEHLDETAKGKHCAGMAGIIEEGKSVLEDGLDEVALDAAIIAAGQRAEHYEMAAYGTLVAWARAMGHEDAAELLEQTLEEEKAADQALSSLAEGGINEEAASAALPGMSADDSEDVEDEDNDDDEDDEDDEDADDEAADEADASPASARAGVKTTPTTRALKTPAGRR